MEHIPNDNTISTTYWEDCKGYSRHVHPRVRGDERDFGFLRKKLQEDIGQGLSSKKGRKRKARHVPQTSNPIPQEQDLRVQNPLVNGVIQIVVQGSIAIVEKPEVEVGTKSSIAVVDTVIEKLIGVDPSPPTAPSLLPNPTHTNNMVAMDAINKQPCV